MSDIDAAKVEKLKAAMKNDFPDLQFVYKEEGYPDVFILKVIEWFVFLVGLISPSFEERFNTKISNGVFNYVLLPDRSEYGDFREFHVYKILRHEYVHMKDMKRRPVWFILTYLISPLPAGLVLGRAHWEMRGYTQNLLVSYEETGEITDEEIEWVTDQFCNSTYFWMLPFRRLIRRRFESIRDGIEKGEISGFYPEVGLFG